MQSAAKDVDTYLQEIPQDRLECLTRLRELCQNTLTGYEEGMEYGMPVYTKNGIIEVAFASQKNHISLYIWKLGVVDKHRDALTRASIGKGCIRYSRPAKIDFAVVEKLLTDVFHVPEEPS